MDFLFVSEAVVEAYRRTFLRLEVLIRILLFSLGIFFFLEIVSYFYVEYFYNLISDLDYPYEKEVMVTTVADLVIFSFLYAIIFSPLAVMAHRSYLLNENWSFNIFSVGSSREGVRYLGNVIIFLFMAILPLRLSRIFFGNYRSGEFSGDTLEIFTWGLILLATVIWFFITVRWYLIFPATAIGKDISKKDSSTLLAGKLFSLIIAMIVANIPLRVFNYFSNNLLVGDDIRLLLIGGYLDKLQYAVYITIIAFILSFAFKEAISEGETQV